MQQQIRPHADVFDIQDRVVFVSNSDFVSNSIGTALLIALWGMSSARVTNAV
jgi:hypothetical protein